jgi:hypothetical protein
VIYRQSSSLVCGQKPVISRKLLGDNAFEQNQNHLQAIKKSYLLYLPAKLLGKLEIRIVLVPSP